MRYLHALLIVTISVITIGCSSSVSKQSYTNPILAGDYPDPTIIREGSDYYMTHSAFDYLPGVFCTGDGYATFKNFKYRSLK